MPPSQLLFLPTIKKWQRFQGGKMLFSNVASDDTLELYFLPPESSFVKQDLSAHFAFESWIAKKLIEEEKNVMKMPKCLEQKSPRTTSVLVSLVSLGQDVVRLLACQLVRLSFCQLVNLSACQLVWLSVCQFATLSACQAVRLAESRQCWSEIPLSSKMLSVLCDV